VDDPADVLRFRRVVGDRIREARHRAGLTQQALAEAAGLDKQAVSLIENAHVSPRLDTMRRIACALGEPLGNLVCESTGRGLPATGDTPGDRRAHGDERDQVCDRCQGRS
jgi:transcriptional regulator with XRE-family HTH domain